MTLNRKQRRAREKQAFATPQGIAMQMQNAARLADAGRRREAEEIYRAVVTADPKNQNALFNAATLAHQRDDIEQADMLFTRLARIAPGNARAQMALAFVRMDQGEIDAALELAEKFDPKDMTPELLIKNAVLMREAGRLENALEFCHMALEKQPGLVDAYYVMRNFKKFTAEDADYKAAAALWAKRETLTEDQRVKLGFAIAKMSMDIDRDEDAFAALAEANALHRKTYKTPVSLYEDYADSIIRLFDAGYAAGAQPNAKPVDKTPVFIVGMPRSGSTLIDQIIAAHPDAASIGEATCFKQSIPFYPNRETPDLFSRATPSITKDLLDALDPRMLGGIARDYTRLATARLGRDERGCGYIVDKMLFNFLWVGVIRLAMPQAKIIHARRDPMDNGLSIWQLMFTGGPMPWAYDLEDIGRFHRVQDRLMQHWKSLFPGDIHTVDYEDMVANTEKETRKLLAYCELDWHDDCLEFYKARRQVKTASAHQVRKPVYKTSSGKAEKYRAYLEPLARIVEGA